MAAPTISQLSAMLPTLGLPVAHPAFLAAILTSCTRPQPLAAVAATLKHRLLSADISGSAPPILAPTAPYLPLDLGSLRHATTILPHDVFVQLLEMEDLGRSKWDQVESLEAERKGETTKGREIIRVVPAADQDPSSAATQQTESSVPQNKRDHGPYKLILQDWKGTKAWAFELKKIDKLGYPPSVNIGCKLWLRKGCKVARGTLLMEPATVEIVGGKIETMEKAWKEKREDRLREILKGSSVSSSSIT
ncbi:hypothetical protein K3495_g4661 [Podosphaera aphanis]|nr:hypothetical protein K3495_g4661 [Podosphaera aphanis]